jgi:hypothetical protein
MRLGENDNTRPPSDLTLIGIGVGSIALSCVTHASNRSIADACALKSANSNLQIANNTAGAGAKLKFRAPSLRSGTSPFTQRLIAALSAQGGISSTASSYMSPRASAAASDELPGVGNARSILVRSDNLAFEHSAGVKFEPVMIALIATKRRSISARSVVVSINLAGRLNLVF